MNLEERYSGDYQVEQFILIKGTEEKVKDFRYWIFDA